MRSTTKKGIQMATRRAATGKVARDELVTDKVATTTVADAVETLRVLPSGGELRFDPRGRLVELRIPAKGRPAPHQYRRDALDEAEAIVGQRLRLVSWKVKPDGDYVTVDPVFLPGTSSAASASSLSGVAPALLAGREPRNDA